MSGDPDAALRDPARLEALWRSGLMDSPPEAAFDRLTRLAARALGASSAAIILVGADRTFVKSAADATEWPEPARRAADSLCREVVRTGRPLAVEDLRRQPPDPPGALAYLGVPLATAEGHVLGGLGVLDHRPRAWTRSDVEMLGDVAAAVMAEVALREAREDLRQSEGELKAERDFIASVLETTDGLVLILDRRGRVLYFNRACREATGFAPAEVEGRPYWDVLPPPGEAEAEKALFARLVAGATPGRREVRWRTRGGDIRLLAWSLATPTAAGGVPFVIGTGIDLTEQRWAEEALRAEAARHRAIFERMPDATILADDEGRVIVANAAAGELLGLPHEELVGRRIAEFTGPDRAPFEGAWRAFRAAGRAGGVLRVVRPDGTARDAEYAATADVLVGRHLWALRDATERLAARRALGESEARYRWLVENATEEVWRFELEAPCPTSLPEGEQIEWFYRHGYLAECNPAMARTYGYDAPERMIGLRLGEILVRSEPGNAAFLRDFIRSGYRLLDSETITVGGDGRLLYSLNNLVGLVEGGTLVRAWGTSRDITRLKQVEAELRGAKEAAEAASRAREEFLAALSHELRIPLTPVLLAVTAMLEDDAAPAVRHELDAIRRNVELEAHLIDDLLDVSRIVRGGMTLKMEAVDVHQEVRLAVEICHDEIDAAGLGLELDLSAPEHHAQADRARIKQVMWNLVRNAATFTPAGGTIAIRSRNESGPRGPLLVVEVRDSGIGIEPEALGRIFEPFEQGGAALRRRHGGLGLGLAIARGLAEAHGGRLAASSPGKGQGSTFRLELPTIPAPRPEPRPAPAPAPAPRGPDGLRLLLVEDNEDTLDFLSLILRHRGHAITAAATLCDALDAIAGAEFDLVISDIDLPDGTGLDLVRELRARGTTPAIALSGFGSEEDVRQGREAGFSAHLTKPIDIKRLEAVIHRVVTGAG